MEYLLMAVGGAGAAILYGLRMWRARTPVRKKHHDGDFASAARASVMHAIASRFLVSLGNQAGGILVLNEVYPFDEYVRLRHHTYEQTLGRSNAERTMGERFAAARERWTDAQRAAVDRLEQAWPGCEEHLADQGMEVTSAEFADVVLITKLCRLLDGPIAKNHAAIINGFLSRHSVEEVDNKGLIIQFVTYAESCRLLPNTREIGARLCVLRATTMLVDGEGDLRGVCENWGEQWSNHFPKHYVGDDSVYVHELYLWILAELFAQTGREIPYLDLRSGVFAEAVEELQLQRDCARTAAALRPRPQL